MDFPAFPPPDGAVLDEAAGTVTVPLQWFVDVAKYKADVDALEEQYRASCGGGVNAGLQGH